VKAFGPDEVILFPSLKAARRLRLFLGYTLKAITEVWNRNCSYDIIELWGGLGWCACLLLTRWRRRPYRVISRSNGLEPHYRQMCSPIQAWWSPSRLLSRLESFTDSLGFRHADTLTVVSGYDQEFALRQCYQPHDRLVKIDNSLPEDWLHQQIQEPNAKYIFGFVGSWLDRKGAEQLIKIINSLKGKGSQAEWIIAGVGASGKGELLKNTALKPWEVYEHTDRMHLKQLYRRMTALLCLSSYESFGMVCSEAMACGCMLLSTDVGFASSLKAGEEYIQIDRNNTDAITNMLLEIERDSNRYRKLNKRGYARVQKLQWTDAVDVLERHYRRLLEADACSVK
jgi:glycosyltransferase involved in cell wall biosynthesis